MKPQTKTKLSVATLFLAGSFLWVLIVYGDSLTSKVSISKSLVIGDTLSVGTTTPSANSLFTAGTSSPIFYIDNISSNVGIGTANPAEKFHVVGNMQATAFLYSSDRKLKENIRNLSSVTINKLLQLEGVSFMWKDGKKKNMGFIAQEVEKLFPELVSTDKYTGLKSVQYAGLLAPLIETVKKQHQEIAAQREEIETLKTDVRTLKNGLRE